MGAGYMAQWLRACAAPNEDPSWVSKTPHEAAYNCW